ncbi:MAG: hypothetical protein ACK4ZJ_16705, partial [Allorhizobium sp.]
MLAFQRALTSSAADHANAVAASAAAVTAAAEQAVAAGAPAHGAAQVVSPRSLAGSVASLLRARTVSDDTSPAHS